MVEWALIERDGSMEAATSVLLASAQFLGEELARNRGLCSWRLYAGGVLVVFGNLETRLGCILEESCFQALLSGNRAILVVGSENARERLCTVSIRAESTRQKAYQARLSILLASGTRRLAA